MKYKTNFLEKNVKIFYNGIDRIFYWFIDEATILVDKNYWKHINEPSTKRKLIKNLEKELNLFVTVEQEEDLILIDDVLDFIEF